MNAQISFEYFENTKYMNIKDNNIIEFSKIKEQNAKNKKVPEKTTSKFTSLGKLKATAADSVKTLEEIEKIKKYFLDKKEYRNYCLFIVGITTGYRISDILKLKIKDFFDENYSWKKEIDIIEQKTKKRRKMPITDNIKKAINLYLDHIITFNHETYIFKSQKGKNSPLDKSSVRKIFNDMAIKLKLPYHCSTHFLRKTFAYWFLQVHKDNMSALATLQDILNHSSEKMTLKYCGIEKQRREKMINTLSELW